MVSKWYWFITNGITNGTGLRNMTFQQILGSLRGKSHIPCEIGLLSLSLLLKVSKI